METLNKVIDALHGALARYDAATDRFVFQHCSDSFQKLFDSQSPDRSQFLLEDALSIVCPCDRQQVEQVLRAAQAENTELDTYCRIQRKNDRLNWCQLDTWAADGTYYVLFSGLSPEAQLFQSIAGEAVDSIYVIDKQNYTLLYTSDLKAHSQNQDIATPKTCFELLHNRTAPCPFCSLESETSQAEGLIYEFEGRTYSMKVREIDWNGIPSYVKYVRDITEEIADQKEKARLEQYFQTVVKYLPGGMAVIHHDVDGSVKPEYLSEGFSEMLEMSPEDAWAVYQDNALSGVHPEDRGLVSASLSQCIQENRDRYELQYRLQKGNGEYMWVNTKFSVIQCDGGDVRVYADYHDITAEKKMQEQLRQQYHEQIHQHYLMAGPDALILGHCNIPQNLIYEVVDNTDSGLLELFGTDREAFFTGLGTLIPDAAEREQFYAKFLNAPTRQAYEDGVKEIVMPCFLNLPHQRAGKYVQFKVVLVEMPDTGEITGILSVTDNTKQAIREQIFMQLSSTNYDLVADIDLLNDHYEIVSGGDDNIPDRVGRNSDRIRTIVEDTLAENEQQREYVSQMLDPSAMLERLRRESSYSFIYSLYNSSGEIRTKKMIISAIDLRLERICVIRADVTDILKAERKAKEELETALTEAKHASQVKSDFLSSMSHDIRTPMNAIVGMTALATANLNDREKLEDYLRKISVSSQHLLSLINDILDMSQIEQSKIHLNLQPLHIEELIGNVASIMTSQAENLGLSFRIESGPFRHVHFSGDALRIKQILINLLSNAFKFTTEGGDVLFRTEELTACDSSHVRYRFTIQDTGIGMSEEFLSRLFEPFIRSEKVTRVEGSGLGLSITKGLVDLMGGVIHVESQLQKGTKFQIELEFAAAEPPTFSKAADSDAVSVDLTGYHFLLVEDNEINSEILGELLQMRGATFTIAPDGLQAVNEFRRAAPGTYDAIFMDIQMPVMNGYEATREIRKLDHPDAAAIPILAMTANAFAKDVRASLEAGMNGHIAKPVDMDILYNTLQKFLKKP